jgi:branched-chain amino acid transport system ATP-binding protein
MSELRVSNLAGSYGQGQIIQGIELTVPTGSVTCLLGLNGMGKTTTLRAIMGLLPESSGSIEVDGRVVSRAPNKRAMSGLAYVPEDRQVFSTLTVSEHLRLGRSMARTKSMSNEEVFQIFPKLADRQGQLGGTMSGGEQQMLVVARAIVTAPKYVLLDEPSEGLAPEYVHAIYRGVDILRSQGIGILLVEQNFKMAVQAADSFVILNRGSVVARATRAEVDKDPTVVEKHLSLASA